MKSKISLALLVILLVWTGAVLLLGQANITGVIQNSDKPAIAVPDFRGAGDAQKVMNTFNTTLWNELDSSGILKMVAKTVYPLQVPQQPADFKPPTVTTPVTRNAQPQTISNGPWLTDWSGPPVNANDLAFGYAAAQDGRLVLFGWLYNLSQPTPQAAQLIGKTYTGPLDNAGAVQVAREFAADILQQFGAQSLAGSKIFFVSDRTGNKEIWSMDYDGSNQKQLTHYNSISSMPAVSPDGKLFAFTTYPVSVRNGHKFEGNPQIVIMSTETGRKLTFYNPVSSNVETAEFSPDGQHLFFASAFDGIAQICESNLQGGDFQRISHNQAIEVSPKINPKTGREMLFISGRSGREQLWLSNVDGSGAEMLTDGSQYVANPAWSPNAQFVAYAATGGYEPGNYNIFIMDIAKRVPIQLTHGNGRNENPTWGPDGVHIAFSIKRGSSTQIYTMLADGTHIQQLTTQGNNIQPVWAKGIN